MGLGAWVITGLAGALALAAAACTSEEVAPLGGAGGAGGAGANGGGLGYALPQFVRGAALVNPEAFPAPAIVIRGANAPTQATLDGAALALAAGSASEWLAAVDATALGAGEHALVVSGPDGTASGTLVVAPGSAVLSSYAEVGAASYTDLFHDEANDQLLLSWIDTRSEKHARLAKLDGAGRRIPGPADLVLDANATDTVRLATAFGPGLVGALYHSNKDWNGSPGTRIELRVLDLDGSEVVAPIELNPNGPGTLGTQTAVAWDGAAFDAVWADFAGPGMVKKLYWARVEPGSGAVTGPVEIADGSYDGTNDDANKIQDLQALALACNAELCVVGYRRHVYHAVVGLSAPKVFLALVATADGSVSSDAGLFTNDWDIQEDPSLSVGVAGDFVLTLAGTDTAAVLNEPDPCDASGRQKIYHLRLDAAGAVAQPPLHVVNDDPGQRYQATAGAHPDGAAVLWEDEREKCVDVLTGQNRLAVAFVKDDAPEAAYLALPGSRLVLESWIAPTPVGPSYAFAWIDERAGGSVLDPRGEVVFDTYWRR
ncbi:MAG: hypothetical protein HY908_03955 [Myxococcales bacterium]|nr:hypothetical protein [Myxococcales bacterium]